MPGRIISAAPPTSECTTGRPSAIASSAASEKVSTAVLHSTIASQAADVGAHVLLEAGDHARRRRCRGCAGARLDRRRASARRRSAARAPGVPRARSMAIASTSCSVVLLGPQHRATADHEVRAAASRSARADRRALFARARPPKCSMSTPLWITALRRAADAAPQPVARAASRRRTPARRRSRRTAGSTSICSHSLALSSRWCGR